MADLFPFLFFSFFPARFQAIFAIYRKCSELAIGNERNERANANDRKTCPPPPTSSANAVPYFASPIFSLPPPPCLIQAQLPDTRASP
jgi:hypothetical protein